MILCLLFYMLVLKINLELSKVNYGFGLLTLSNTRMKSLDVIENEGIRVMLCCTKDTSAAVNQIFAWISCHV